MNHTCSSLVRITSLTRRSFVPSSPRSSAALAKRRASRSTCSCPSRSRESCTGTSSRPRGRTLDPGHLRHVVGHRDGDAPQELNPLRHQVHQLILGLVVLIEEQVQLVEGLPRHLPVVLLVHVPQGHGVRQHLVEGLHALLADLLREPDGEPGDRPEGLQLPPPLPHHGARRAGAVVQTGPPAGAVAGAGAWLLAAERDACSPPRAAVVVVERDRRGLEVVIVCSFTSGRARCAVRPSRAFVPPRIRQDACHDHPAAGERP